MDKSDTPLWQCIHDDEDVESLDLYEVMESAWRYSRWCKGMGSELAAQMELALAGDEEKEKVKEAPIPAACFAAAAEAAVPTVWHTMQLWCH